MCHTHIFHFFFLHPWSDNQTIGYCPEAAYILTWPTFASTQHGWPDIPLSIPPTKKNPPLYSPSRPPMSVARMKSLSVFGFYSHTWPITMWTKVVPLPPIPPLACLMGCPVFGVSWGKSTGATSGCDLGDWTNCLCSLALLGLDFRCNISILQCTDSGSSHFHDCLCLTEFGPKWLGF